MSELQHLWTAPLAQLSHLEQCFVGLCLVLFFILAVLVNLWLDRHLGESDD